MKHLFFINTLILILLLGACSNHTFKPSENSMILSFKNNANFDFYSLEISNGLYTAGISYADGSKIKKGELLQFEIVDQKDMNLEGEGNFQLTLIHKEERFPLNSISIELQTNTEYTFEIIGQTIENAQIEMMN